MTEAKFTVEYYGEVKLEVEVYDNQTKFKECHKPETSPFAFSETVLTEQPNPLSHKFYLLHVQISDLERIRFNSVPSHYPSPEVIIQNFAKHLTDLQFGKNRAIETAFNRCNRFEMQFIYAVPAHV